MEAGAMQKMRLTNPEESEDAREARERPKPMAGPDDAIR
jgi:hypothetical protein